MKPLWQQTAVELRQGVNEFTLDDWFCGNCAMFWPEPFCDYCGKTLKGIDRGAGEPTEGNPAPQTGES